MNKNNPWRTIEKELFVTSNQKEHRNLYGKLLMVFLSVLILIVHSFRTFFIENKKLKTLSVIDKTIKLLQDSCISSREIFFFLVPFSWIKQSALTETESSSL